MKIVRRITLALSIAMPLLSLCFLGLNADGGAIAFFPEFNAEQEQALARLIGFDLAPGETYWLPRYEYRTFEKYDFMSVHVNGVASAEEFLSRLYPETAPVEGYESSAWERYYEKEGITRYCLYGSRDFNLQISSSGSFNFVTFEVTDPAGKPALDFAKNVIIRNNIFTSIFFVFYIIVAIGWLMELAFITVLVVMRRKAKKNRALAAHNP